MKRRDFVLGVALLALAAPAQANGIVDALVAELRAAGYTRIEVGQTWLGRTRIVAEGARGEREIVVNPRTGEVLRDLRDDDDDDDDDSGRGRGRGGDDDDGDDDRDDDRDDDNDNDNDNDNDGGDNDGGDGDGGDD